MKQTYLFLAAFALCTGALYAADSAAAAPAPAPTPVTYTGFVDAYYSYNFANPNSMQNEFRNFDFNENQFVLSLAELVIQKAASPVGFRMDIDYGRTNDIVQSGGASTLNFIQQAYVTAVLPWGSGLTVDVGKFVTHMGYEVIESNGNWNYSRSFMFAYSIPYYHTGMRLTYPISNTFTAALHIVNGWNGVIDNNKDKSVGLQLTYSPTASTSVLFSGMIGNEQPTGAPGAPTDVGEIIVTQTVNDNLSLAIDADYGQVRPGGTGNPLRMWKGVSAYGRYTLDSLTAFALRLETYNDGYNTVLGNPKATLNEVTLTYERKIFGQMLARVEVRDDMSNVPAFDKNALATEKGQVTGLVGLVVAF
jgi:Putative beta-barrel porin-2, OmpL-like. bbp2